MNLQNSLVTTKAILRTIVPMTQDNHLFQFSMEGEGLKHCMPGQFVQMWIPGVGESPISICSDLEDGTIEFCVRRVGRVTNALFEMQEGQWVGLRGPYGRGFPLEALEGKNVCLVAGGLGVAPIRGLLQYILHRREKFGHLTLIYGMRHSIDLLFRHELKVLIRRPDIDIFIGAEELPGPEVPPVPTQLGRVTDMLRMARLDGSYAAAICGPPIMYPYVIRELKEKGLAEDEIFLLLERHMKCAIGKCGHCFMGGKLTCKAGPVYSLAELRLVPEVVECVGC